MAECCIHWARTDGRLTEHHPNCPAFKEERFVKIHMEGGGCYIQPEAKADVLLAEIRESEPGTKWTVELVLMTAEEYARLPEFMGH